MYTPTAPPRSFSQAFDRLPLPVRALLLHHSALPESRMQAGLTALDLYAAGHKSCLPLAQDLLLAAWECRPHDAALAGQLLALHGQSPFLSPPLAHLFAALQAPLATEKGGGTAACLPLAHGDRAAQAFAEGRYADALEACRQSRHCWPGLKELEGHCLLRLGERAAGLGLWRKVLQQRPWHGQLILSYYDYAHGHDQPLDAPPVAVLLYSWNKAPALQATLQALEASLPDISRIVCLNNGSTDDTAACMQAFAERWGPRFVPVQLPVNVGAAAARNWLAALPEVQALPFAAFVDDDVCLPPDWLGHLARALRVRPGASAWGCRILEAHHPHIVQSGPLHLTLAFAQKDADMAAPEKPLAGQAQGQDAQSADLAFSPLRALGEPFSVTTMPPHCLDGGRWNFIRSCASVTGCCHLFRTEDLQGPSPFSLSLSPSQYDDLEHDLRSLRAGRLACYTGFCAGLHAKNTGGNNSLSPAAYGNGLGNKYKLHGLFSPQEILHMARQEHDALENDLQERLHFLDEEGGEPS